jgi:lactoylglutathione lyase
MSLIHTCYRILDPERSIAFYEALGFNEIGRIPILRTVTSAAEGARPDAEPAAQRVEATNIFMGLPDDGPSPRLELTHNHGRSEPYEIGTGYGHIAITAPDLDSTLGRLKDLGIEPERPPYTVREGGSRLCFVRDPDGYRIEIIERDAMGA